MDENKAKKVLELEFLKELPDLLVRAGIINKTDAEKIGVTDKGSIFFSGTAFATGSGQNLTITLINYLASELASAKVDLLLKNLSSKKE
jgi:hypothetical protein